MTRSPANKEKALGNRPGSHKSSFKHSYENSLKISPAQQTNLQAQMQRNYTVKDDQSNIYNFNLFSDLVGDAIPLKKVGKEYVGPCLINGCNNTSFYVNNERQAYHCKECGAHGNIIDWLEWYENLSSTEVKELMDDGTISMAAFRKYEKTPKQYFNDKVDYARSIWQDSKSLKGTIAEVYLKSCDINALRRGVFRFHSAIYHHPSQSHYPALVVAVKHEGRITGVQCIFLKSDGSGRADVKPTKMGLGVITGSATRLSLLKSEVILVEKIEDGLNLLAVYPGACVWAVHEADNLKSVHLPASVSTVTIGTDNYAAGVEATDKARDYYIAGGYDVKIIAPPALFKNFTEALDYGGL